MYNYRRYASLQTITVAIIDDLSVYTLPVRYKRWVTVIPNMLLHCMIILQCLRVHVPHLFHSLSYYVYSL